MSAAQSMISRENLRKPPQCVVEGHAPTTYGVAPSSPIFSAKGLRSVLSKSNEPEFADNDFGGNYDRQGITKTREKNTVTFRGRLLQADIDILKWANNLPNGAGTPAESRTWLDSYLNSDGAEIYRIWKGCKVITSSLIISSTTGYMMFEINMSVKEYTETTAHGLTGTPSFATKDPNGTAILFKDLGAFVYGSDQVNYRNSTITTTFAQKMQDSNGSETDLYMEPTTRRITGSMDIFKKNQSLNEDARIGTQKSGYLIILKSATDDVNSQIEFPSGSNKIKLASIIPGAFGNSISYTIKTGSTLSVEVDNLDITITLGSGGSTLTQIKNALAAHTQAAQLVASTVVGTGSTNQTAAIAKTSLAGGVDNSIKFVFQRLRFLPSGEDLIDSSDATMESKSLESDSIAVFSP